VSWKIKKSCLLRVSSRSRFLNESSRVRPSESKNNHLYYHFQLDLYKALTSYFHNQHLGSMLHQPYQASPPTSKLKISRTKFMYHYVLDFDHKYFQGNHVFKSRLRTSVNITCQVLGIIALLISTFLCADLTSRKSCSLE
jgi:hypothetical protein